MIVTKTFIIEMMVNETLPPEDMDILCQVFSADIVQYNLNNHISRPHYVKYAVKEVDKAATVQT